jgi:hypothetical protein
MRERDLYWLAGLLEGEGSFQVGYDNRQGLGRSPRRYPRLQLRMTDEDVIARAAALLGCSYHGSVSPSAVGKKPVYGLAINDARAVALMRQLRPLLGERRQQRIDEILAEQDPTGDRYADKVATA